MTKLYSYETAAEAYGIPADWLREAVNSGQLKAIKRGNNYVRLTEKEIDRFIESETRVQ